MEWFSPVPHGGSSTQCFSPICSVALDIFFVISQHLYEKLPFRFIFNSLLCITYFHIHNPAEPMPSVLCFLLSCVGWWNLCQNSKVGGSWRSAQLYFMIEGHNFAWYFKLYVLWQISQLCMCKSAKLDVHWSLVFDYRCGLYEVLPWPLYQSPRWFLKSV